MKEVGLLAIINVLSPRLADMIAAGEVVERPASAIKELIENSFDAGAKNITVELRGGGAEYIRVTDDGCGMAPEDAGVCFLRHATSKLHNERDLEAIGTMGFRGEALAAIAAVSHIELLTRRRGDDCGVRMTLEAGDIEDMRETGCPVGTSIIIKGLFFNTPARLKFMKTDRAEGAACCAAALRCALGRPDVSLRLIRDGEEQFFTPGDGRAESAIYSLLGREAAAGFLPCLTEDGGVRASGFVSSPSAGRGSRAMQYFFCNGRYIKSQLLQAAVEQAYKNNLLVGRYPACVIYLTLAPGSVDVNVHPAKTEVKFSEEKRVFDAVYYAALGALAPKPKATVERKATRETVYTNAPEGASSVHEAEFHYQTRLELTPPTSRPAHTWERSEKGSSAAPVSAARVSTPPPAFSPATIFKPAEPVQKPPVTEPVSEPVTPPVSATVTPPDTAVPVCQSVAEEKEPPARLIGEALNLYLIAQKGDALILIDKHAAHERMIFNALRERENENMCQTLLVPVPLSLSGATAELLEENGEALKALGFEAEPYGEGAYILRAVPDGIDPAAAEAAFTEALDVLSRTKRLDKNAARDEALKTIACKAAIKAGMATDELENQRLVDAVCTGEITHCPHGRPVAWTLTREELDKQFKRIV